jgi:type VI secretion system protein ImpC
MAKIAAAAHCPYITGASPAVMQMESWQELSNPRDLSKIFLNSEYVGWRHLREMEDSRYLGLTMPRFLARLPYGVRTNPVDAFNFEEDTDGANHERYAWINSAYAMATNINRSFKLYGWCTSIRGVESGGAVEDLPTHSFPTSCISSITRIPALRHSSAPNHCSGRRSITTPRPRTTRGSRHACPTCSRVAALRTI